MPNITVTVDEDIYSEARVVAIRIAAFQAPAKSAQSLITDRRFFFL
jgi:hypothetical protein